MFWKRLGFVFLILFFVFGTLTTIGQKPAMAEELKLIFAHYVPPAYKDLFPVIKSFPDYINEHGKGKVQVEHFHSGTLLKSEELLPGLMQGTADVIWQIDAAIMGTFPILGITELPLLYPDVETSHEKLKIGSPLYKLINQELAKKNIIAFATFPTVSQYIWTKKPIRKPDDLKGLRIRVAGRVEAAVIKALGAVPTTTSSAELYEALQRGTVDGAMCAETTIIARGFQDMVKYVTKPPLGASYSAQFYMRLDKWQSLPPDIQKLFIDAGKNSTKIFFEHTMPFWNTKIWTVIRNAGIKEIVLTKEEKEEFKKRVLPVWDWWKDLLPPGVAEKAIKLATE